MAGGGLSPPPALFGGTPEPTPRRFFTVTEPLQPPAQDVPLDTRPGRRAQWPRMHPRPRHRFLALVPIAAVLAGAAWSAGKQPGSPGQPEVAPPEAGAPEDLECVVILRDGRRLEGLLVRRDANSTVVRIGDVYTTIAASEIDHLDILEPVSVRYRRMREAIADHDSEQILLLAEWLLSKKRYATALTEVLGVLDRDPDNIRAQQLQRLLEAQISLLGNQGAKQDRPRDERRERSEFPVLTPEQINLIKVYEVDLRRPPRIVVPREVIDAIVRDYGQSDLVPSTPEGRQALQTRRPEQILDLLFRLRARELYGQVRVTEHPDAMRRFKDDVHAQWLMRSCATTRCHGGEEAGRLWLLNRDTNSDETVYTNFLILERFRLADGTPLINYAEPASSPLLQMALPPEDSTHPHPPIVVGGRERVWKPIIRSQREPAFQRAVSWIRSMYRPRTDYPIEYTPPVPGGQRDVVEEEPR